MSAIARIARDTRCLMAVDAIGGGRWLSPVVDGAAHDLTPHNVRAESGAWKAIDATPGVGSYVNTPLDLRGCTSDLTVFWGGKAVIDNPDVAAARLGVIVAQGSFIASQAQTVLSFELRQFADTPVGVLYLWVRAYTADASYIAYWPLGNAFINKIGNLMVRIKRGYTIDVYLNGAKLPIYSMIVPAAPLNTASPYASLCIGAEDDSVSPSLAMQIHTRQILVYADALMDSEISAITKILK